MIEVNHGWIGTILTKISLLNINDLFSFTKLRFIKTSLIQFACEQNLADCVKRSRVHFNDWIQDEKNLEKLVENFFNSNYT